MTAVEDLKPYLNGTKSNTIDFDSICERLDDYTIEYIQCYEQILLYHDLLDKCLSDGYLQISKARSLIGCASLSILQIPAEINANVAVKVINETGSESDGDDLTTTKFSLVSNQTGVELKGENKTKFPTWFGVLAPLSLKTSQKSFCKSLDIIADLCELQFKLKSIERKYKNALKEKTSSKCL